MTHILFNMSQAAKDRPWPRHHASSVEVIENIIENLPHCLLNLMPVNHKSSFLFTGSKLLQ